MSTTTTLDRLEPGTCILVGGHNIVRVPDSVAQRFRTGDALVAVESTGELLLIPEEQVAIASHAVGRAYDAFRRMGSVSDGQISRFYQGFARRLEDDAVWKAIAAENANDVADASARGRTTTRLVATQALRQGMIEGLYGWERAASRRGQVFETVQHDGWRAELIGAELGVVGFVFEGRPNVLADATGVLRGGNTVVFRIGRDALGTARAMMRLALEPALVDAGLPEGACSLVESSEHAAGWALFRDQRLALAVARGSGPAVATLGSLAKQSGIPVSLHGTGGAWLCASADADAGELQRAVVASLDRKVCNTLNTLCVIQASASRLVPAVIAGLREAAAQLDTEFKLHVAEDSVAYVPPHFFGERVHVHRAQGRVEENRAEVLAAKDLGREWEWERSPEVSLKIVESLDEAIDLFNRLSPRFVATLVGPDLDEHDHFYRNVDAPFVGDGFTRWVDGQYALKRPELGLSNWQNGRLLGRGGVLSGDSVYTIRTRVRTDR